MKVSPETWRARVVKGWAFRGLPEQTNEEIHRWLETGDMADLPESYHTVAQGMIDEEGAFFQ